MRNKRTGKDMSYVISVYRTSKKIEERPVQFDSSTNIPHASTIIAQGTKYVTKSKYSQSTKTSRGASTVSDDNSWNDFYRVNISYKNMKNTLDNYYNSLPKKSTKYPYINKENFASSLNPADWQVTIIGLQYEIANEGKGSLAGSFRAFEAYLTNQPI